MRMILFALNEVFFEDGRMNWDDLMFESGYSLLKVYSQSKLANVLFTRELAKRLPPGVTTYALHPGVVDTELFQKPSSTMLCLNTLFRPLIWLLMKTPKQGAQTSIYCCTDKKLTKSSGLYYSDCREETLLPHALSDEDARRLWETSKELVKNFL
jgi:NAD(P)-dependent dehydrogenase (short-subunit alcohol dehydrogenase family)